MSLDTKKIAALIKKLPPSERPARLIAALSKQIAGETQVIPPVDFKGQIQHTVEGRVAANLNYWLSPDDPTRAIDMEIKVWPEHRGKGLFYLLMAHVAAGNLALNRMEFWLGATNYEVFQTARRAASELDAIRSLPVFHVMEAIGFGELEWYTVYLKKNALRAGFAKGGG